MGPSYLGDWLPGERKEGILAPLEGYTAALSLLDAQRCGVIFVGKVAMTRTMQVAVPNRKQNVPIPRAIWQA